MKNGVMMQYFEWHLAADSLHWQRVSAQAQNLRDMGVTSVWLPPAYKGAGGFKDVGYGPYDLYDLGEFAQKDTVATKYGTKQEYLQAVKALQGQGLQVLADIVLNHKMGADSTEIVKAYQCDAGNRQEKSPEGTDIEAWTLYNFPGRHGRYSDFVWHWQHFTGVDWDVKTESKGIFLFAGKEWCTNVDQENGNFDYLMGANVDLNNPEVKKELKKWGKWYLDTVQMNGFRLDALKHMDAYFYKEWLDYLRRATGKELFSVGEYWSYDINALSNYLDKCEYCMSLMDVPLHFNFYNASKAGGNYDMGSLLENTLLRRHAQNCVTFVDNHDTQDGQALYSWIEPWFKPLAYAVILLRDEGYPCVFYGDYYGIPNNKTPSVDHIVQMVKIRLLYAYGTQHDYFDHRDIVGWTREGDPEFPDSGLAVLLSDNAAGQKKMYVGKHFAKQKFYEITRHCSEIVEIDEEGQGTFFVEAGSVCIWLTENAYRYITVYLP